MPLCAKCKTEKDIPLFHRDATKQLGVASWCKQCVKEYGASYRYKNKEVLRVKYQARYTGSNADVKRAQQRLSYRRHREAAIARSKKRYRSNPLFEREYRLNKKYGITHDQWTKLYKIQNGVCPICELPLVIEDGYYKNIVVDHDHITKRVRGLLCQKCNMHRVCDNTLETAKKIIPYLESTLDGRLL